MNQTEALKILKSGANVFLTGEPGSGKTYTINQYVTYLRSHGIEPAITASTGIAATHIGGMTIHSWSGIGIKNRLSSSELTMIGSNDYVKKRISKANILIIDEISMLPPQTLQMVDAICKVVKNNPNPFGGMQIVLVGDFFQLPPVVKQSFEADEQAEMFEVKPIKFAYDSPAWKEAEFVTCYICDQYRQDDSDLVELLSKIRSNQFDDISRSHIEKRKIDPDKYPEDAPKLYTHNFDVDDVNSQMLKKIDAEEIHYQMHAKGHDKLIAVMKKGCLSPENLFLKIGASVMFTKNNQKEGYVNGTLGTVDGFNKDGMPVIKLKNGRKIEVEYAEWTVEEDGKVKGTLAQLPLRLAWAITVHKSQGISLDEAIIDLSKVFEFGQGYVALSRVRRLTGVHIIGYNEIAFKVDPEVIEKDVEFRLQSDEALKVYSSFSEDEMAKMQESFIELCDGEIDISDVIHEKKSKSSTYDETLKQWKINKNIKEVAEVRSLSENTILSHIEKLVNKNEIERGEILEILPAKVKRALPKILDAFIKLNTDKLSPVYEELQGKYSYEDLRLARLMI